MYNGYLREPVTLTPSLIKIRSLFRSEILIVAFGAKQRSDFNQIALTSIAERLTVELSLHVPVLTTLIGLSRLGFEHEIFRLRVECSNYPYCFMFCG